MQSMSNNSGFKSMEDSGTSKSNTNKNNDSGLISREEDGTSHNSGFKTRKEDGIFQEKKALRKRNSELRDHIPEQERLLREQKLLRELKQWNKLKEYPVIYLYCSFRSEFPTYELLAYFFGQNKEVLLPRIEEDKTTMNFYPITSRSQLKEGYMGILEPVTAEPSVLKEGLMFLPGLAFDSSNARLGYGGGFYDRFLERAARNQVSIYKVGLCFAEQMVEQVPRYEHDIRMDEIIAV